MTKKLIKTEKCYVGLEGQTIAEAITHLHTLKDKYGPNALLDEDFADKWSDSDAKELYVYVMEEESDEAYAKRIAQEKRWKELCEQSERETFERLQKKFANG